MIHLPPHFTASVLVMSWRRYNKGKKMESKNCCRDDEVKDKRKISFHCKCNFLQSCLLEIHASLYLRLNSDDFR